MADIYLKFPDEETFETFQGAEPFEYGEGGVLQSEGWSIDILGGGFTKITSWSKEGEPTYSPVEGFLVNLRSANKAIPDSMLEYQVYPRTPIRVWA